MSSLPPEPDVRPSDLTLQSVELASRWIAEGAEAEAGGHRDPAAERLAGVLRDPDGLEFAVGFVDGVARPQDVMVAGRNLQQVARNIPAFLPWYQRAAIWLGGVFGPWLPWVVVPVARAVLRRMVGHLVVDATPDRLGHAISRLRGDDGTIRLNLNLLGEAVLGENEAASRLAGTRDLLARDDVDYVSIKVSSVASQLSMWAFDETVARIADRLTPLYELAAASASPKFINLDMEEYRDLDLTIAIFKRVLGQPQLKELEAGIVLQAYLPDALDALQELTEWSQARRAGGGAPIKVRIVKGANLAMERVDAAVHGWPLAPYDAKVGTDTNYKRVLDWALTPEHTHAVKLGVAGHNMFDIAHAWLLARSRGVEDRIDFEMLLGMASGQADAVKRTVGSLLLYTPVVHPRHFDVAISYLMRRLEENASSDNFMSAAFELAEQPSLFVRERDRFAASMAEFESDEGPRGLAPLPNRRQDRVREWQDADTTTLFRPRVAPVDPAAEAVDEGLTNAVLGLRRGHSGGGFDFGEDDLEGDEEDENGSEFDAVTGEPSAAAVVDALDADRAAAAPDSESESESAPQSAPVSASARASAAAGSADSGADASAPASDAPTNPRATFRNESDTDPALPSNRTWGRHILARSAASTIGSETVASSQVRDAETLDLVISTVQTTGEQWGSISGAARANMLDRAGLALAANRDRLIEVMASETGKTIAEADPEVSEAIDFAHYYAARARELDTVQGARFVPSKLTVVTPPWNFPVSIPAGSVLGPLAAGSGVIIKPAPQAKRSAAIMVEALWEAGIPRELLAYVDVDEGDLGRALVADQRVDRVILTGSYDTAALFRSWRPDLPLLAETSGKNAIIVTPSADYDLAVADIVASAFGNAGQKCSAASLVILVGSVATSARFRNQLVDATESLRVGYPQQAVTEVGPLIEPASGKLLHALTELGAEESWMVAPEQLDETGRLWSPGIREGVTPGSYFHLTEFFGPVLGIMRARSLEQAIVLQNAVDYGLTSGLHSLDTDEIAQWIDGIEAGNLYVNRGITGAIVQRQPFGGWKRSTVGAGAKAGGPNYLFGLGSWVTDAGPSSSSLHLRGLDARVSRLIESGQASMSYDEFDLVRRSALSDAIAYAHEFGAVTDVPALGVERNLFRYRSVPVSVRLAEGGSLASLLRVLAAATVVRGRYDVSVPAKLSRDVQNALRERDVPVAVESDASWLQRMATGVGAVAGREGAGREGAAGRDAAGRQGATTERIRLVDGSPALATELAAALGGSPDVAIYAGEVTASGRVELLPFVREQAISITNHRFGDPSHLTDELF